MAHIEPLSQPTNRPPNTNEKTFEELFTVTCTRHVVCCVTYLIVFSNKMVLD